MQNEAIAKLIKEFKKLNISEREKCIDFVSANSSPSDFKFIIDTKLADGATAYDSLASKNGLERVEVNQFGLHNIQRMNSYHSRLKGFIDRFNGVSTKHLNGYLVYNNFANHAKETYSEKVRILTNHICSVRCFTKRTKVSDRPMIPVLDMAA